LAKSGLNDIRFRGSLNADLSHNSFNIFRVGLNYQFLLICHGDFRLWHKADIRRLRICAVQTARDPISPAPDPCCNQIV
jgi:hypothetical protein